jgi:SAV_6107-like HEPN
MGAAEVLPLLSADELPAPVRRERPGRAGRGAERREPNRVARDGGLQGELLELVPDRPDVERPAPAPGRTGWGRVDQEHGHREHGHGHQELGARQLPLPMPPALPVAAAQLLGQAHRGLAEAAAERAANERYATAHLAALRAAAALLAARAEPETGRRRPRSAWVLISQVAPELAEWATFFAAGAPKRAAAEAGLSSAVTEREADDLVRDVATFLRVVESTISRTPPNAPARPRPGAGDGRRPPGRPRPRS